MTLHRFALPDLGEGLTEGEILHWLVAPGDTVVLDQPIVEVETAKAAVEIPSPYAGVVAELFWKEGATVDVGQPIIAIESGDSYGSPAGAGESTAVGVGGPPSDGTQAGFKDRSASDPRSEPEGRTPNLVGYGPDVRTGAPRRRPRVAVDVPAEAEEAPTAEFALLPTIPDTLSAGAKPVRHGGLEMGRAAERTVQAADEDAVTPARRSPRLPGQTPGHVLVRAKPPVRKLARDLGVDLATVTGTGPSDTVSRQDVLAAAVEVVPVTTVPAESPAADRVPPESTNQFVEAPSGTGRPGEERIPVRGIRRATAAAMVASVGAAPHVTVFLTVDMTRTLKEMRRLRAEPDFAAVRVGPLLFIAKALLLAVDRQPMVNGRWVDGADGAEIVVPDHVNLGIATATPRGLLVPSIKDADRLSLPDLAQALSSLVDTARAGRATPADLRDGTISITNVGVFGVDAGTPILNPGETAILCVGQIAERPWVHKGKLKARPVCPLALSFDHRVLDGEEGARFLADVGAFLTDPARTTLAWS
jgi:2-oxoisovalerate dehydrogenase E2 component (dihydrolipoyl transacylase)